jgi:hypothetical protein
MKLKKIILGSLLSFTALVSLASCDMNIFGNNNSKNTKDNTQIVETTTNSTTSSSETVENKKEVEVTKKELTEEEIESIASTVSDEKVADAITLLKEYSNTLLNEYKKLEAETDKAQNDKLTELETKIQTINLSIQNLEAKIKSNEDEIKELKGSIKQPQRTRYTKLCDIGNNETNYYEYYYSFGNTNLIGSLPESNDDYRSKYAQMNLSYDDINDYYIKGASFKIIKKDADYYYDEDENIHYYPIIYDAIVIKKTLDESTRDYSFSFYYFDGGNYVRAYTNSQNKDLILVVIPSTN